ncbi:uncharacterized protein RCC_03462 [Ramularia collo-cygni]|uniref:DUF7730 domain-containing protein n=1 Tax=Ramularia collo-cygni TaxID=112498 RepID=A0A2D3UUA3_9PEZI|nr:uncharacterized protein RCC_03462 [Ramularia collo-cygni]CZT17625.1 uncharacterized protein RCC_03462 [Ramularia collo-cygni]
MSSTQKATFETLPVETRCQIYRYLLEEDEPVQIALTISGILARRGGRPPRKGNRRRIYNKETKEWVPAVPIKSAIIFVNHKIYAEAIPILYGKNCFEFRTTADIKKIVAMLGERTRLLRYIKIAWSGYFQHSALSAFNSLLPARGLRKITIHHQDVCPTTSMHPHPTPLPRVLSASKNLLRELHNSYKEQKLLTSVLDVIQWTRNPHARPCGGSSCAKKRAAEFRSLLAAALKIENK